RRVPFALARLGRGFGGRLRLRGLDLKSGLRRLVLVLRVVLDLLEIFLAGLLALGVDLVLAHRRRARRLIGRRGRGLGGAIAGLGRTHDDGRADYGRGRGGRTGDRSDGGTLLAGRQPGSRRRRLIR